VVRVLRLIIQFLLLDGQLSCLNWPANTHGACNHLLAHTGTGEGCRSAAGIGGRNRSDAHEEELEVGRICGAEMKIMMQDANPRKSGFTSSEAKVVCNYMCRSPGFL